METTRRTFLGGLAAASVPAGAGVAVAAMPTDGARHVGLENPDLITAYAEFSAAQAEVAAAKDTLEWLADEWKHVWPLAPEELLDGANAHHRPSYNGGAPTECDILDRPLMRDTSAMTKRFSAAQRRHFSITCFTLYSEARASERLAYWQSFTPKGRTANALAKSHAAKARNISELTRRVELAREYEAETARVRNGSGVDAARGRVVTAESRRHAACAAISRSPAHTVEGLRIKAEALMCLGHGLFDAECLQDGVMGDVARFITATASVAGGLSA